MVVRDEPVRVVADERRVLLVGRGLLEQVERLVGLEGHVLAEDRALARVLALRKHVLADAASLFAHGDHESQSLVADALVRDLVHLEQDHVDEGLARQRRRVDRASEDSNAA